MDEPAQPDATETSRTQAPGSRERRYFALPQTTLGRWSLALAALFFVFMTVFYVMAFGEVASGADSFIEQWPLWGSIIPAAACGIGAFVVGLIALIARGERSLLVLLSVGWGGFVAFFVASELLFPH